MKAKVVNSKRSEKTGVYVIRIGSFFLREICALFYRKEMKHMIWYETLTRRYFQATKKDVKNFVATQKTLGEVLDFLEKKGLPRVGFVATLDPSTRVCLTIVGKTIIINV